MKILLIVALSLSYTLGFQLGVNLVKDCQTTNNSYSVCKWVN